MFLKWSYLNLKRVSQTEYKEKVLLFVVKLKDQKYEEVEKCLLELKRLVETLGGEVVASFIQKRELPSPATFIGKGKAFELKKYVIENDIDLVVFDNELSGSQHRELEKILDCRVTDRTGVILDIFSKHARSREAKNQVDLAKLEYLLTHLTHRWTHLERQRGGIGLRGVGEKQLELDRRIIRKRIARLKEKILASLKDKNVQNLKRQKFIKVSIVGYTNAGKSTLMNNLTASDVYVDDSLFATLDSTVRIIDPKTKPPILISDTVGFIDKLPHSLIASFRSTLQQVLDADLLLHVVDVSEPTYLDNLEASKRVLKEINAHEKPTLLVFNKVDKIDSVFLPKILERKFKNSLVLSALNKRDMARLRNVIYEYFETNMTELEILVPYSDVKLQSEIYEYSKIVEKKFLENHIKFRIKMMTADLNRLKLLERGAKTL